MHIEKHNRTRVQALTLGARVQTQLSSQVMPCTNHALLISKSPLGSLRNQWYLCTERWL